MSGCLSWMCPSTFVTSSSSLSPRTVSPHGHLISFAISSSFPGGKSSLGLGPREHQSRKVVRAKPHWLEANSRARERPRSGIGPDENRVSHLDHLVGR